MLLSWVFSLSPPTHDGGTDAGSEGELLKGLVNLDSEFAGRAEDDGADTVGGGRRQQTLEEREHEGESLARSGLGGGNDVVAAGEDGRNGLLLDRCGFVKARCERGSCGEPETE